MNDVQIQYQGFHPSKFTRGFLDVKLNELHNRSPYGSTLRATFIRDGRQIKAVLRVLSSAGEFFAIARGNRMRDVSRKVLGQIYKQLNRWKDSRHAKSNDFNVA